LVQRYEDVVGFMKTSEEFHPRHFESEQFSLLNRIFNKYKNGDYEARSKDPLEHEIESQISKHIEGVLVGPITVFLGMDGMFHKYFMEASFSADEFHEDPVNFSKILDFFCYLGWFSKKKMSTIVLPIKAYSLRDDLQPMGSLFRIFLLLEGWMNSCLAMLLYLRVLFQLLTRSM